MEVNKPTQPNMTELPLLTVVTLALPSRLQAIYHIPHLINHFLVPSTIDAAVYLDLQRVSNVFGTFRPLTVGAMDGAAAQGRLDIIKWLHANRWKGCSAAAFNGAAANNHLVVLRWLLRERYRRRCNFTEALAAGAGAGHLRVVKYITAHVYAPLNVFEGEVVVEAAMLNDQVEILEYLLNVERNGHYRHWDIHVAAVNIAAKNGLTRVMRFLLHIIEWFDVAIHNNYHGLEYAAAAGYSDIVALLLEHGCFTQTSLAISVEKAAEAGRMKVVFMLLPRCGDDGACRAVAAAVANNYSILAELLVRFCSLYVANVVKTANNDELVDYPASYSKRRFVSAAASGNEQDVKAVMRQVTSVSAICIGYVVEVAAALSQCRVVNIILEEITSRNFHVPDFVGVKPALKRALESNDLTMARLLTAYCDRYTVGTLLNKCATRNQVEAVRTLAERSFQFDIAVGAFEACMAGREGVFGVLMESMEATTALQVSVKLAKAGKIEFVKRGLKGQQKLDQLFAEAVASGNAELVNLLLDKMSGPVIGFALLTAARFVHIDVVKLLNGKSEPWGVQFHALEEAAKAGKAKVVDYLRLWCSSARITTIVADLRASGEEEAAVLLDTKRARFE